MTRIIFHGNKNEIMDLHSKIEEWTSTNLLVNGFGPNWLGNIVAGAGLGDRIDADNRIRCRGSLENISEVDINTKDDALFYIDTDTAWSPMVLMWDEIFKAMDYKTIDYSFQAEEPGMGIYIVMDPYGDFDGEKYYVDIWLEGVDELNEKLVAIRDARFYGSDDALILALQNLLDTTENDINKLIKMAETYKFADENSCLYIHEYESVSKEDIW